MRLLIAGSRGISPEIALYTILKEGIIDLMNNSISLVEDDRLHMVTELVTGKAQGVDQIPYLIKSILPNLQVAIKEFPADWNTYNKAAGPIRNAQMADYADVLILVWDGKSRGSANMKLQMERLDKPIMEIIL